MTNDIDDLKARLAQITAWRAANMDKMGTAEYTRSTFAHRLLTDLVRGRGGTPEERAEVMRRLNESDEDIMKRADELLKRGDD